MAKFVSVCIATFERSTYVGLALRALAKQTRLPDEIIVCDASHSSGTQELVSVFVVNNPNLRVIYLKSERKALPWQRWMAFQHSVEEIVLFIDDDVQLVPSALAELENAYQLVKDDAAGIGFTLTFENGEELKRNKSTLKEWWLGTARYPSGAITPGGLTVSFGSLDADQYLVQAGWLWGGGMSYPRTILNRVGCLENLIWLYDQEYGRSEDAVLSHEASRHGNLYLINKRLAFHPRAHNGPTPYPSRGWNLGVTATFGRFHIVKWLAKSKRAFKETIFRIICLEIARAIAGVIRAPYKSSNWFRLAGTFYGIGIWLFGTTHQRPFKT